MYKPRPPRWLHTKYARSLAPVDRLHELVRLLESLFEVSAGIGLLLYLIGGLTGSTDSATLGVMIGVLAVVGNLTVTSIRQTAFQTG